ncbi:MULTISPECIES: zinc-binding dehydrogenase [unclassified Streptomyces]|uniref:quinone oxidoreductase family protein n=1 Tax=unclassified Streptomyces TaxID=2593676 RepID=UPI001BE99843|nr:MULTISPECIES: zinc-binding dehydrogenase [unclassified Streptomyces]MBT2402074.1 zinc-binding dehydrogenase [Streptomyces sp. ISL-21]MBT2609416.1 zinc-binding dehydrogenase [Streptomyces sp. ISL-87]
MLRIRHEVNGGPEVLFAEEVGRPEAGAGELLIRVEAVGVTLPTVRKVREGSEPISFGGEVAGEIVASGAGVTAFGVGDRVTGLCFADAYAEFAVLNTAMTSRIPDGATAVEAVALVRSGLVARGAYEAARMEPGESVLVTAAASAVGTLALQYAKAGGAARVVAAVSSADKADFVRGLGADEVLLYEDVDWGTPYDVILDGVGGDLLGPAVRALATGGRLVAFSSGGGTVEAYELLVRGASMIGFQMRAIAVGKPELYDRWLRELWQMRDAGTLRTAVHEEIPLREAARAHTLIEQRRNLGKVVLVP